MERILASREESSCWRDVIEDCSFCTLEASQAFSVASVMGVVSACAVVLCGRGVLKSGSWEDVAVILLACRNLFLESSAAVIASLALS